MSAALCAIVCAALAGWLFPRGRPIAWYRLTALLPPPAVRAPESPAGGRPDAGRREERLRWGVAALAGAACAALVGVPAGLPVGAAVAFGCARTLARMEPPSHRRRRARLVADLPVAVDLLAACLSCGTSWGEAVEAVADAVGGPLGDELRAVAAQVRLGADPARAWLALAREPALAPLARAVARAAHSGTALTPTLARLARDQRRSAHAAATVRARAAGVRAVAPLGLCFLPAFVLLGIVPAVAGIASTMLSSSP
ncbi:type II secretion system F family protein [Actinomadura alba]|uniref:Type II secretion system F family protein n=1 Tax=Actinomadura alba TaxID=406431 RepID=A0ABR7M1D7_9ACTN|nr:type II secretion system F family protein [Actinomadura alba]MBC6470846.1 type II secretion system F family protein [Actinomadura alba]